MNLARLSKKELLDIATKKKIPGRAKMTKTELIKAVEPFYSSGKVEENAAPVVGYTVPKEPERTPQPLKKDEYPIPDYYNTDTLNFMPVDPSKEYAYWEISDYTFNSIASELRLSHSGLTLKVFMNGASGVTEAASVSVERVGSWYFNIYAPDVELWSEIGFVDSNGAFHAVLKSNRVKMPADKVSDVVDKETWLTVGGHLEKLYELSGAGKREDISSRGMHRDLAQRISQHIASSGTLKGLNS